MLQSSSHISKSSLVRIYFSPSIGNRNYKYKEEGEQKKNSNRLKDVKLIRVWVKLRWVWIKQNPDNLQNLTEIGQTRTSVLETLPIPSKTSSFYLFIALWDLHKFSENLESFVNTRSNFTKPDQVWGLCIIPVTSWNGLET